MLPNTQLEAKVALGVDLHDHGSLPWAVVEVDQDDLLPGAEAEVPVASRPSRSGTDSEGPTMAARMWACELVSPFRRLCS